MEKSNDQLMFDIVINFIEYFDQWEVMDKDLKNRMIQQATSYYLSKPVVKF